MDERDASSPDALRNEIERLRAENRRLRSLLGSDVLEPATAHPQPPTPAWEPTLFRDPSAATDRVAVGGHSSPEAKIALFRSLLAGREDIYAARWENERSRKSGWSPVVVGGPANARRPDREYVLLGDGIIEAHLTGRVHVGLYPLLRDDACRLLACDFDGPTWPLDAGAFVDAAQAAGIPMALERSRSGEGAHVWMFFSAPAPASAARRVGAYVLREAMTVRAEIDLASYDRLFPAQDFMPKGSFGNLIALPLQGACRRSGTTVFLDPSTLQPFDDQWAYLSALGRNSPEAIESMAESVRQVAAGPLEPTYRAPHGREAPKPPPTIVADAEAMLLIDRIGLPPALLAALKHLASLHNPAYYEKERLRLSTWKTHASFAATASRSTSSCCRAGCARRLKQSSSRRAADSSCGSNAGIWLGSTSTCKQPCRPASGTHSRCSVATTWGARRTAGRREDRAGVWRDRQSRGANTGDGRSPAAPRAMA
jgi:hypothetical protein